MSIRSSLRSSFVLLGVVLAVLSGCSATRYAHMQAPYKGRTFVDKPSQTGFGPYLAAMHARRNQDFDSAADYYIKVLEKDPGNRLMVRNAYTLLASEGRIAEAAEYASRGVLSNPKNNLPVMIVAVDAAASDDFAKASALVSPLGRRSYNRFLVPLMLAWIKTGENKADEGLEQLETLRELPHLQTLYHFHAGLICDLTERNERAFEHYEFTLAGPGGLSLRAVQVIGNFYRRNGKPEKAIKLVNDYIEEHEESVVVKSMAERFASDKIGPRPVASAKDGLAEALFGVAATMSRASGPDIALLFVRFALHLDKDFDLALVLLGDLLEERGLYKKANAVYDSVPKKSDVYFSVQMRKAVNLGRIGKVDKGIALLKSLTRRKPDIPGPYTDMGDILRVHERFEEAVWAYNEAHKRIETIEPHHWAFFYTRGICLERLGRWDDAEKDFLKALELEPDHPFVLNYLGYSWLDRGMHIDKALVMLRKAYEQRPADGFIVDSLGWALYMTGQYKESLYYMEQAAELEPGNSVINYHLGDVYWRLGRKQEAMYQWRRALDLDTDLEPGDSENIRKRLKDGLPPAKPYKPATEDTAEAKNKAVSASEVLEAIK